MPRAQPARRGGGSRAHGDGAAAEYAAHEGDERALFALLEGGIEVVVLMLTGSDVRATGRWQLDRDPYLFETSVPGMPSCTST